MCGRMTQQTPPSDVARIFQADVRDDDLGARYNVAPTQPVAVVVGREDGRWVETHRWGLVPSWARTPAAGSRMINARLETVEAAPAFRVAFRRRRCIVPADGFFEWRSEAGRRQPYLIAREDRVPLAMAGLWAPWRDPATGEWLLSCAVITRPADGPVASLHDRMPALLPPDAWTEWLDPMATDAPGLRALLERQADDPLALRPVSMRLNDVRNEGPELLVPAPSLVEAVSMQLFPALDG